MKAKKSWSNLFTVRLIFMLLTSGVFGSSLQAIPTKIINIQRQRCFVSIKKNLMENHSTVFCKNRGKDFSKDRFSKF